MDERVQRVVDHIQGSPSFVCNPAKAALKRGTLVIPDSVDPESECLIDEMIDSMRLFLKNPNMEGALIVSQKDPDPNEEVLGLLPTIADLADAIKFAVRDIMRPSKVPSWRTLLNGHAIGVAEIEWSVPKLVRSTDGILVTAHGPAYPEMHPRYQPHPTLAIVLQSAIGRIAPNASQAIYDNAQHAAGRKYLTSTFLLPLKSEREF